MWERVLCVALAAWSLSACDDASPSTSGGTGSVSYRINVSGSPPNPVFEIQFDSETPQPAGASCDSSSGGTITNVSAGQHTLTLRGLPSGCTVGGASEKTETITVSGGATASVDFDVDCPPSPGSVYVRMRNETSETFDIAIGRTSFGTLGPGEYSDCIALEQGGALSLYLDGEVWANDFKTYPTCPQTDSYYDAFIAESGTVKVTGSDVADASICD